MTGHEALNVAQVDKFEATAFLVLILQIVVEDRDLFVSQHQSRDLVQLFAHQGIVNHHLLGDSFALALLHFVSGIWVAHTFKEIHVDFACRVHDVLIKLVKNVVQVLKLVFDSPLVEGSGRSCRLWSLTKPTSCSILAIPGHVVRLHHSFEDAGLLRPDLALIRICSAWSCHFRLSSLELMLLDCNHFEILLLCG